ncbi:unnamed protein product [Tetraodon nigroviridis]|uniref:(spotted green pufferfish) hypothetical protein n=1 Tax=Tetraodon nigroviridis TaxID=99883 RepID=Q4S5W9_TETNG|nr:unnamed protein product [Tetraodon nigroviridis]
MEDLERAEFKVHDPCVSWLSGKDHGGPLHWEPVPVQVQVASNRPALVCSRERGGPPHQGGPRPVLQPQQQPHHRSPGQQLPGELQRLTTVNTSHY